MSVNRFILFIAFEEFENLGVRYNCAVLNRAGYKTGIADLRNDDGYILKFIREKKPFLIGFSVIYQYKIDSFIRLIGLISDKFPGVHLTAGGHYASLKPEELFEFAPGLNSIVRFEGERPLTELADCLSEGRDWHGIDNLAWIENGRVIVNRIRPPSEDLDALPYPVRDEPKKFALGRKYTTLIAGRGCMNKCAFCNLSEFFRKAGGPIRRLRKPSCVAEEMNYLHREKDASIFLFEDDDFPVNPGTDRIWIRDFCRELSGYRLSDKILWKINCRPDEVDEETFRHMKKHGLFKVFLGIDTGTDSELKWLNKNMTIQNSLRGIEILKKLKLEFDYGFMLFHPLTTFGSLKPNIMYLENCCSGGHTPVTFLKMMPYYNTRIIRDLSDQKRLKGEPGIMDYDFPEVQMNRFHLVIMELFNEWLYHPDGFVNISKWALIYLAVFSRYYSSYSRSKGIYSEVRKAISDGNHYLLESLEKLSESFGNQRGGSVQKRGIESLRKQTEAIHVSLSGRINDSMQKLLRMTIKPSPLIVPDIF